MRQQAESQFANGNTHPFPPSNYPAESSADWSMQWVAAMYDDFAWTHSTERVSRFWPQLVRYMDWLLSFLRPQDAVWTGSCLNDIRVTPGCGRFQPCSSGIVTPWVIERLGFAATMAEAIGQDATAAAWRSAAAKMTTAFHAHHVVPAQGSMPAYIAAAIGFDGHGWQPYGKLQAAHTVAIFTGLFGGDNATAALRYFFPPPAGVPTSDVQM